MKIISFNSYKGGACRTTTCYNTLPFLAKELGATSEEPILVYDIDLDSMGLTSIFHAGQLSTKEKMPYSAKHLFVDDEKGINKQALEDLDNGETKEYFKHYEKVGKLLGLEDEGSVLFLGADRNASTITDDDYNKFKERQPIQDLIKRFRKKARVKAIVFDCASGVQMTTLVALQLAHCSVVCMRPTYQFRVGTSDYILRQIPAEIQRRNTNKVREVVLLPTAVAQINVSQDDPHYDKAIKALNSKRKWAFQAIDQDIVEEYDDEYGSKEKKEFVLNTEMLDDRNGSVRGIPEVERFKWQEELLYTLNEEEMTKQELELKDKYKKLAGILAREVQEKE